jgi:hypothetical protein
MLLVTLALAASSCGRTVTPVASGLAPSATLDSASATDFTAWARAQDYSSFIGDSQRLALRLPGAPAGRAGLSYGPLAWIYPLKGLGSYGDSDFGHGRIIARIHAEDEYRKLGLRPGENYLIVQRLGGGPRDWRAMMRYPNSDSVTYLEVIYEQHSGTERPPETVRFAWSDVDEDLWGRCSSGCCRVIGFRAD